jgi:hypothetical protein
MLFDEIERTLLGPAAFAEDEFSYFNRSADIEISRIRQKLEQYYSEWPREHAEWLRNRCRTHFQEAFFELFIHAYLLRIGCSVEVVEEVPNKTTPDFLATFPRGQKVIIEATVAKGISREEAAKRSLEQRFYDGISSISLRYFYIAVVLPEVYEKLPSAKGFRNYLGKYAADHLKEEDADRCITAGTWVPIPYQNEKCEIRIAAVAISKDQRDRPGNRTLGSMGGRAKWGLNSKPLIKAVESKANHYGKPVLPFVIAVNYIGEFPPGKDGEKDAFYRSDDRDTFPIWCASRNGGVSAILSADVHPSGVIHGETRIYHCPHATHPCDKLPWKIDQGSYENGNVSISKGNELWQIFTSNGCERD